jgi:HTH-like domain
MGSLLRREGWLVNKKRIYRLWREEGLKVPDKQRKRRRLGDSENSCTRRVPDFETLQAETSAWQEPRDTAGGKIEWRFGTDDVRIKLKRLYPSLQE